MTWRVLTALLLSVALLTMLAGGCVIADPPTELPRSPERRPIIVRASVVPSTTSVISGWPSNTKFIVPVELSNPTAEIAWATFIDYNPATGEGFVDGQTSVYESASTSGNVRVLELPITMPSLDRCHVVEVIVALRLTMSDPRNAHSPEAPGGDSVSWFFNPSGDLAGCPILDAGLIPIVATDAEAGVEAGGTE
ncbi:MAG: hypothetical protein K0S65_6522 [Labilithrix sp.]|nr:hypothetical protein [Labilithrix sp.]